MFQTRRALKYRIEVLEHELKEASEWVRLSKFAEELPKCKNPACIFCEHCIRYYNGANMHYAFGCLKGVDCEHFKLVEPRCNGIPVRCYNANQTQNGDKGGNSIGD